MTHVSLDMPVRATGGDLGFGAESPAFYRVKTPS